MDIDNTHRGQMHCAQFAESMLLSADGELNDDELLLVEDHVAACAACRAQWALFRETDRSLLTLGEVLESLSPSDPTARDQVLHRLARPKQKSRVPWLQPLIGWQWAPAALGLLCAIAWMLIAPSTNRVDTTNTKLTSRPFSIDESEVVHVKLPLSPVGNPFLDGSQSESTVPADVVLGPDGIPQTVRLAN